MPLLAGEHGANMGAFTPQCLQEGKLPKPSKAAVSDSDEEETPDVEFQLPAHKVKLMIGPGGEKIKWIQRKSKCRVQARCLLDCAGSLVSPRSNFPSL